MQHCEECGAELPHDALFCGSCGKKTMSEDDLATIEENVPIEDVSESPSDITMALNDSQDTTSENEAEEKQQTVNSAEEEEQTSYVTSEHENEEQTNQEYVELSNSMPGDAESEPDILANRISDELPQDTQTPIAPQETQSHEVSVQKSKSRPVSRCLLFSLVGLIVIVGVVVSLVGFFRLNLPGFGGSSNALSSSSNNEIIDPNGSSLTASICVKTSTPSTSVTNQGSTFTLFSSSGCSTVTASKANSSCLIFPNTNGASRKYIFDVSNAAINSNSYHLVFGVVDYTGPTMYSDARHISIGLSEGSTGQNFSWFYRSGSVTINNEEQSGTMDVILEAVNGGNTIHLVGDWACGRQMKNI
jgi:predicted nucleic acid-binding Zn ribbon protein